MGLGHDCKLCSKPATEFIRYTTGYTEFFCKACFKGALRTLEAAKKVRAKKSRKEGA